MPPGEPLKCKVVSFRIAADEYSTIEALAKNNGFASVSYFAREAILRGTRFEPVKAPLDVQIDRLGRSLEALILSLGRVLAQLGVEECPRLKQ